MFLADCICTSSVQSFNLVTISCLQWAKYSNVIGLELVGGVRGDTAQDDVVFKTVLQDFERLVRPETVTNQNPRFLMHPRFGLGIKHPFEPLQADLWSRCIQTRRAHNAIQGWGTWSSCFDVLWLAR